MLKALKLSLKKAFNYINYCYYNRMDNENSEKQTTE